MGCVQIQALTCLLKEHTFSKRRHGDLKQGLLMCTDTHFPPNVEKKFNEVEILTLIPDIPRWELLKTNPDHSIIKMPNILSFLQQKHLAIPKQLHWKKYQFVPVSFSALLPCYNTRITSDILDSFSKKKKEVSICYMTISKKENKTTEKIF